MKWRTSALIFIGILIASCVTLIIFNFFTDTKEPIKETKVIDSIVNFPYILEDRDYLIYQDEFTKLKSNLESDSVVLEEYAQSIAKLFIIDLYTLDNKLNKYDVGGAEFFIDELKENYKLKVEDTLYKYLKDNTYGDRSQVLPIVNSIEVKKVEESQYNYNNQKYDSYIIDLEWTYEVENNYDTKATITIININKVLYIAEATN